MNSGEIPDRALNSSLQQQLIRAWNRHYEIRGDEPMYPNGDFLAVRQRLAGIAMPGTSASFTNRVAMASEAARLEVELARTDFSDVEPEDFTI